MARLTSGADPGGCRNPRKRTVENRWLLRASSMGSEVDYRCISGDHMARPGAYLASLERASQRRSPAILLDAGRRSDFARFLPKRWPPLGTMRFR